MTVGSTVVGQTYPGDGLQTNFAIPFEFKSGETDVIKVILIENDGSEVDQVLGADFNLNDPNTPTLVQMTTAPAADEELRVERQSTFLQNNDLINNAPNQEESIEDQLDRLTYQDQELKNAVESLENNTSTTNTTVGLIPDWMPLTDYVEDQVVLYDLTLRLYRVVTAHTSTNSFENDLGLGLWEELQTAGVEGPQGIQGPAGPAGPQGTPGNDGQDGQDGMDGVFAEIANQAEAEAGANNDKGMTPLRTSQAIAAQLPTNPIIVDHENRITALEQSVQELATRVTALENVQSINFGTFQGSQTIRNNEAVPQPLLGETVPGPQTGKGSPLARDGDGTEFAEVLMFIRRKTDTESRFSSFRLIMQFVDGLWYIARDGDTQLKGSLDLDGVTLSIATDAGNNGQVSYVTDNMGGANHDTLSEIKWLGQEIPVGV